MPERALAIGAHPDDIEFGCGGTLAKWAAAGCHVSLLVLTDGSKGTWDADADPMALLATRQLEQKNAAASIGAAGVHFLDRVDGELVDGRDEQAAVCEMIRTRAARRRARTRPLEALPHPSRSPTCGLAHARRHRRGARPSLLPRSSGRTAPAELRAAVRGGRGRPSRSGGRVDRREGGALLAHRSQWRSTMAIADDGTGRDEFAARVRDEAIRAAAEASRRPLAAAEGSLKASSSATSRRHAAPWSERDHKRRRARTNRALRCCVRRRAISWRRASSRHASSRDAASQHASWPAPSWPQPS